MAVEFYMFDDELWFIKDGTENQALSEKDTEVIKKSLYFNFYYTYDSKRGY